MERGEMEWENEWNQVDVCWLCESKHSVRTTITIPPFQLNDKKYIQRIDELNYHHAIEFII